MYTVRIFMKCGPNILLILHQIIKESDFPCLADEKAEPSPDMNIKVTAFTESKKFYYMKKTNSAVHTSDIKCLLYYSCWMKKTTTQF